MEAISHIPHQKVTLSAYSKPLISMRGGRFRKRAYIRMTSEVSWWLCCVKKMIDKHSIWSATFMTVFPSHPLQQQNTSHITLLDKTLSVYVFVFFVTYAHEMVQKGVEEWEGLHIHGCMRQKRLRLNVFSSPLYYALTSRLGKDCGSAGCSRVCHDSRWCIKRKQIYPLSSFHAIFLWSVPRMNPISKLFPPSWDLNMVWTPWWTLNFSHWFHSS